LFRLNRNACSDWTRIGVQVGPEYAPKDKILNIDENLPNDAIRKVVAQLLDDHSVRDIGAALIVEAANLLLSFAPSPEHAYAVIFSTLKDISKLHGESVLEKEDDEEVKEMNKLQNAPSTRKIQ
jgi:hypothetical protein